jgi:diguanylate cyclase (GGDEF)-like protein
MISDTSTILQATGALCLVGVIAFWLSTPLLGTTRAAAACWAAADLLFAGAAFVTSARAQWHTLFALVLPNVLHLGALVLLHAGLRAYLGRPVPWREHTLVVGGATLLIAIAHASGWAQLRLVVYSLAAAWLLLRVAQAVRDGLRGEVDARCIAIIAAPPLLGAALHVGRAGHGLVAPAATLATLQPTAFNTGLHWATLVLALLMNLAVAGFIGARQLVRIRALTQTDPLTGAYNRRAIERMVQQHCTGQQRHGMPLSVVYFDLDHFKALNDRYGHVGGDAALRHAVGVVQASCRAGDIVGRLGGEEFCVVLPFTDLAGACLMGERMRRALDETPFALGGQLVTMSASFGAACADGDELLDAPALLARADRAMYDAKAAGRNCVSC